MTSPYDQAVASLEGNAEQRDAFEARGHCIVLAGPGSGKTRTLTTKMARLLRETHAPRGVACLTYSTECARELRRRLDALHVEESDRAFVGTVHGFCLRHILGPFGRLAGSMFPDPIRVATERQRTDAVSDAMIHLNQGGDPTQILFNLEKLRKDKIDRNEASGWDNDAPLEKLCARYEDELLSQGLVDFDMIVLEALQLVETQPWLRRALNARFPHIVVDEYQDLGPTLHRLVVALCFTGTSRLFAVGDPDQSIYGFNGARPELLLDLAGHPDVLDVRLKKNYRSGERLVRASSSVLREDREYVSTRGDLGDVQIHRCDGGIDGQVEHLLNDVLPDILDRMRPADVIVLYPSKNEGRVVEAAFSAAGIDFVRIGRDAAYPKMPLTRFIEECATWCSSAATHRPRISPLMGRWVALLRVRDVRARRETVKRLVRFLLSTADGALPAREWLHAFETALLDDETIRMLESSGELESLSGLRAALSEAGKLAHFTVRNLGGQVGSPSHVHMLTLHSSKGREFRSVIIVGVDAGRVPSSYRQTRAKVQESRRLFYVGMTRAEDEVHVLTSRGMESPFVDELQEWLDAS